MSGRRTSPLRWPADEPWAYRIDPHDNLHWVDTPEGVRRKHDLLRPPGRNPRPASAHSPNYEPSFSGRCPSSRPPQSVAMISVMQLYRHADIAEPRTALPPEPDRIRTWEDESGYDLHRSITHRLRLRGPTWLCS